jgi:hypothetical protein
MNKQKNTILRFRKLAKYKPKPLPFQTLVKTLEPFVFHSELRRIYMIQTLKLENAEWYLLQKKLNEQNCRNNTILHNPA